MISVKGFPSIKKEDLLPKYQEHYATIRKTIETGLYKEDKEVKQVIDALFNQINNELRKKKKSTLPKILIQDEYVDFPDGEIMLDKGDDQIVVWFNNDPRPEEISAKITGFLKKEGFKYLEANRAFQRKGSTYSEDSFKKLLDFLNFRKQAGDSEFKGASNNAVFDLPIKKISTDEKRFQNRNKLNESTVANIVENYSPTQLDPLIVWKDKKAGKTFLLAGHHRFEALKRLNKKTAPVKFANDDFPTENGAIKYARQLSNANRTLEQPHERAKIYRERRLKGESKSTIDKAAQIEGKNRSYILNLSYLNPTGPVAESLTRFEGATDKDSSTKVEKIADWIGQAKRQNEKLTDSHETEMFKFLNDAVLSKRISSKSDFLQKITSITGDMFFNYADPLNLAKFKYKTEGEKVYEAEVEEIKEEISEKQKNIDEIKQRFLDPSNKNYINPDANDYHQAKSIADEKISQNNFAIQELQKELQQLYRDKGKYVNAGSNQVGLFGSRKKRKKKPTGRLGSPAADLITPNLITPAQIHKPEKPTRAKNLAAAMQESSNNPVIDIPGEIGRFLGQVEVKPVHSVVTTLDAEQGSGKTRFFFQVMNSLAGMGKKCLFYSLEEHPASKLFKDKVDQYIEPRNLQNIAVIDEVTDWNQEKELIKAHDAIFIDSFQKLPSHLDLDANIRKAFNGKWFFIIYQQTGTKGMRGGSKAAFDGDQILKVFKDPEDYRENYVYANKNRYNDTPDFKLNIFTGKLTGKFQEPKNSDLLPGENENPLSGGNLIATPIL